jgi:hypothetical protein
MTNKVYEIMDDAGVTYWVVASDEKEAIDFANEDIRESENTFASIKEIDPTTTPVVDECGHPDGLMSKYMDEKGICMCSEWG